MIWSTLPESISMSTCASAAVATARAWNRSIRDILAVSVTAAAVWSYRAMSLPAVGRTCRTDKPLMVLAAVRLRRRGQSSMLELIENEN